MDQTRGLALPDPGRLEAFSDGVLAIAITLLVLEIKVPHLEAGRVSEPTMNSAADFAAHVPTAMVFRAFNSLGWENFADPLFDGIPADLFYCGPDGDAQKMIDQLIADIGLRPIRVGGLDQIHLVDTTASLWFGLAYGQRIGRRLAFKVLIG